MKSSRLLKRALSRLHLKKTQTLFGSVAEKLHPSLSPSTRPVLQRLRRFSRWVRRNQAWLERIRASSKKWRQGGEEVKLEADRMVERLKKWERSLIAFQASLIMHPSLNDNDSDAKLFDPDLTERSSLDINMVEKAENSDDDDEFTDLSMESYYSAFIAQDHTNDPRAKDQLMALLRDEVAALDLGRALSNWNEAQETPWSFDSHSPSTPTKSSSNDIFSHQSSPQLTTFLLKTISAYHSQLRLSLEEFGRAIDTDFTQQLTYWIKGNVRDARYESHEFFRVMSEYQDSLQSLNTALVQKVSETQGKRQGKQEVNRKVSDATVLGDKLQQLQMEQRTSSIAKKSIASAYKKLSKKVSSSMKSRDRHRDDQENESPFARSRSNSVVSDISSLSERARKQHASVPAVLIASQDLYLQSNQLHTSTEHTMTRIHQVHEDVRSGALPRMLVAHIQQLRKFYQDGLGILDDLLAESELELVDTLLCKRESFVKTTGSPRIDVKDIVFDPSSIESEELDFQTARDLPPPQNKPPTPPLTRSFASVHHSLGPAGNHATTSTPPMAPPPLPPGAAEALTAQAKSNKENGLKQQSMMVPKNDHHRFIDSTDIPTMPTLGSCVHDEAKVMEFLSRDTLPGLRLLAKRIFIGHTVQSMPAQDLFQFVTYVNGFVRVLRVGSEVSTEHRFMVRNSVGYLDRLFLAKAGYEECDSSHLNVFESGDHPHLLLCQSLVVRQVLMMDMQHYLQKVVDAISLSLPATREHEAGDLFIECRSAFMQRVFSLLFGYGRWIPKSVRRIHQAVIGIDSSDGPALIDWLLRYCVIPAFEQPELWGLKIGFDTPSDRRLSILQSADSQGSLLELGDKLMKTDHPKGTTLVTPSRTSMARCQSTCSFTTAPSTPRTKDSRFDPATGMSSSLAVKEQLQWIARVIRVFVSTLIHENDSIDALDDSYADNDEDLIGTMMLMDVLGQDFLKDLAHWSDQLLAGTGRDRQSTFSDYDSLDRIMWQEWFNMWVDQYWPLIELESRHM